MRTSASPCGSPPSTPGGSTGRTAPTPRPSATPDLGRLRGLAAAEPHFGARPGWDPLRERQAEATCADCGGPIDPIRRLESVVYVCMGCLRTPAGVALAGSFHVADPGRPAARAAKVRGRPDPKLNAYLPRKKPRRRKGPR